MPVDVAARCCEGTIVGVVLFVFAASVDCALVLCFWSCFVFTIRVEKQRTDTQLVGALGIVILQSCFLCARIELPFHLSILLVAAKISCGP